MNELKSLDEHNSKRLKAHNKLNDNSPVKNGIACPACGEELYDTAPNVTLASNPPQKHIHCESCGYRGYRIA